MSIVRWSVALVVLLAGVFLLVRPFDGPAQETLAQSTFETSTLAVETAGGERHEFNVELALTPDQRARGLMFRETLAPDAGMLFVYERDQRIAMWMKNTPLPLDMLFLHRDGTVESIATRTVPFSERTVRSRGDVRAVLELNAGTADRLGVAPGDRVVHPLLGGE